MTQVRKGHVLKNDERYTPANAITPLVKYIPKHWTVYEPCDTPLGQSKFTKVFVEAGYSVTWTSLHDGYDFLTRSIHKHLFDCVITNPPFSLKNQFLKRVIELDMPFALLLPTYALNSIGRYELFKPIEDEIFVIVLADRPDFTGKGSPHTEMSYITRGIVTSNVWERLG